MFYNVSNYWFALEPAAGKVRSVVFKIFHFPFREYKKPPPSAELSCHHSLDLLWLSCLSLLISNYVILTTIALSSLLITLIFKTVSKCMAMDHGLHGVGGYIFSINLAFPIILYAFHIWIGRPDISISWKVKSKSSPVSKC